MPTTTDRTWRLQAFTDHGQNPRIEFLRERVRTYEDGGTVRSNLPTVARSLSEVVDQKVPDGPVTIGTMGELFALVAACGHALAAEDDARAAAIARVEADRVAAEQAAQRAAEESAAQAVPAPE